MSRPCPPRTHLAGALRDADAGQRVTLCGWVHHRRDHGGCIFVDLRDHSGLAQVVLDPEAAAAAHALGERLRQEFVIAVQGRVRSRGAQANPKLASGAVEVLADDLVLLAEARPPPFPIAETVAAGEEVRLKHRYLDLRRPPLQRNLRLRHQLTQALRRTLDRAGFVEVETPFLVKSTPEGARDYVVPSRLQKGAFFALPQSPQLFKQLLMVGGLDRYFQIVRCFRDEDLRAERQPEFTQVDLEMSFCSARQVQDIAEALVAEAWAVSENQPPGRPFARLGYEEAMARFGVDAPDLRFGLELVDVGPALAGSGFAAFEQALAEGGEVRAINLRGSGAYSRRDLDALVEMSKTWGARGLSWIRVGEDGGWSSPLAKFLAPAARERLGQALDLRPQDVALLSADADRAVVRATLGNLRRHLGRSRGLAEGQPDRFVWITDFPLFAWDPQAGRHVALHHPFTAPQARDLPRLAEAPGEVRAEAYDLVLNGVELGGGSLRIADPQLQAQVFALLGMDEARQRAEFGFLLDALAHGAPPHGGLALGLDRLAMALCRTASIRDVIAFPKTQKQSDLMLEAPSELSAEQRAELHLPPWPEASAAPAPG